MLVTASGIVNVPLSLLQSLNALLASAVTVYVSPSMSNVHGMLARLSTFVAKAPEFPGNCVQGLHYIAVDFAALDIFGGGWAGSEKPSAPSIRATSSFGST